MVSIESIQAELGGARGSILVLMQEGDGGWADPSAGEGWSDEMFHAYELVKEASNTLDRAQLYEGG